MPAIAPPLNPSELVSEDGEPLLSPPSGVEVASADDEVVVIWAPRQLRSSLPPMRKASEVTEAPALSLRARRARVSVSKVGVHTRE
ncbi:hypothetical protein TRAPUB_4013 [Trametes pubescens]|uniref:Uncharacterized protein n=1 Tax=Trametes pubescens TaxID=154538 RepID=A0A1M2VC76_TRAPU|nr:hypothetical protein TRAPUB_4013 [Trametes pubescens]